MKVEIEFKKDFERGAILPIPLGRIQLGDHIGRLFFTTAGKTVLYVSAEAIEDGSICLLKPVNGTAFTLTES